MKYTRSIIWMIACFMFLCVGEKDCERRAKAAENNVSTTVVQTEKGTLRGKKNKDCIMFCGVPYGVAERWSEPKELEPWEGEKVCVKCRVGKGDDSLFLNITKPAKEVSGLPVMAFLHGGGNVGGSPNKNFQNFVQNTDTIVVSIECRQGVYGWLQSRGLQKSNQKAKGGNFALMDIKLALQWIQKNIEAFGGNPGNVTLAGFSAGARDALNCMISPEMQGLFHRVISFSGGMTTCSMKTGQRWSDNRLAKILVRRGKFNQKEKALRYVKHLSRRKLHELLYQLTDRELRWMTQKTGLRLTNFPQCFRDGVMIPKDGFDCFEYGEYNRVPLLLTSNQSEFAGMSYQAMKRVLLKKASRLQNKSQFYRVLRLAKEYGSKLQTSFYLEKVAMKISIDSYHEPVFTSRFSWGDRKDVTGSTYSKYVGSVHGMDLDFLLGIYKRGESATTTKVYTEKNKIGRMDLTNVMQLYIKHFMIYGNPNEKGSVLPVWKRWHSKAGSKRIMLFYATDQQAMIRMTSHVIHRGQVKREMKRRLSKKIYVWIRKKMLKDRFFV